jgi:polysaccharide chain length determinant protein (PEP-CTERM system associated)
MLNEQFNQVLDLVDGMWRYRWSALMIVWLVAIAGWLCVYLLPDQYRTKAVVYVDQESMIKPLLKGISVDANEGNETVIVKRILLSRQNLEEVLRSTDMDLKAHSEAQKERLLDDLRSRIAITGGNRHGPSGNIYAISFEGDSPKTVYHVVNTLLNAFVENSLNSSRSDTEAAQRFLNAQIRQYEDRLTQAEQRLANFKQKNAGLMPDEKGSYYERIQRARDAIEAIRAKLKLAIQRQAEIRKQLKGELPVISSADYAADPNSQAARARLRRYEGELAELLTRYTRHYPKVMELQAKIEALKTGGVVKSDEDSAMVQDPGKQTVTFNPVYQDLKVALSKTGVEIGALRIQLADQERKVAELQEFVDAIPEVEAGLARLNRDYTVTRERYLALVQRRESAHISQQAEQNSDEIRFRVIDPPVIPATPSGPSRLLFLTAVLGLAVAAGVGWAFLRLQLRPTFQNARQLRTVTELPVFGAVMQRRSAAARTRLWMGLASFSVLCIVLLGVYLGVLIEREKGSQVLRTTVAQMGELLKDRVGELREQIDDQADL